MDESDNKKTLGTILLIVYCLILIGLNIYRIFNNNFWGDEIWSIRLANLDIKYLVDATANDVHPPLYYLYVKLFVEILGNKGWVFHLSSVFPYILECICILTLIRKKFGNKCAAILFTFISLLYNCVEFNNEVRMYSLASLFCLISYLAFYNVLKRNEIIDDVIFVTSSLCAAYTHYYALVTVAFLYIALLIKTFEKRIKFSKLLIIYVTTILGYLPWFFTLLETFGRTKDTWWMSYNVGIGDCLKFYFESSSDIYTWLMFFLFIGLVIYEIVKNIIDNKNNKSHYLTLTNYWLLWGVIASLGTIVIGQTLSYLIRPFYQIKYVYPSAIYVYVAFSYLLEKKKNKWIIVYACVFTLTLCANIPRYIESCKNDLYLKTTQEETIEFINSNISKEATISSNYTGFPQFLLPYYLKGYENINCYEGYPVVNIPLDECEYLILQNDVNDEETTAISNNGYKLNEEYCNGVIGTYNVHIYKVEK